MSIGESRRPTGFIEYDGDVFLRVLEEREQNANFGYVIVCTTSVAAHAASCSRGGEEDNRIAQKLDIGQQIRSFLVRELGLCGIELEPDCNR